MNVIIRLTLSSLTLDYYADDDISSIHLSPLLVSSPFLSYNTSSLLLVLQVQSKANRQYLWFSKQCSSDPYHYYPISFRIKMLKHYNILTKYNPREALYDFSLISCAVKSHSKNKEGKYFHLFGSWKSVTWTDIAPLEIF